MNKNLFNNINKNKFPEYLKRTKKRTIKNIKKINCDWENVSIIVLKSFY